MRVKRIAAKQNALSDSEIQELTHSCSNIKEAMVVMVPLYAGLRVGELAHMNRSWLNSDEGTIDIPAHQFCQCRECRQLRGGVWSPKSAAGAYRQITAADVRLLTECSLIGRYRYYGHIDLQTVRCILRYEELREKRIQKQERGAAMEPLRCKICGEPLPIQPEGKMGRPREYCPQCEASRSKERNRKWRTKRRALAPTVPD